MLGFYLNNLGIFYILLFRYTRETNFLILHRINFYRENFPGKGIINYSQIIREVVYLRDKMQFKIHLIFELFDPQNEIVGKSVIERMYFL